ncbi:MAG: hypothetical protein WCJ64_25860, partial [Rhodospirillaceae bacterium]
SHPPPTFREGHRLLNVHLLPANFNLLRRPFVQIGPILKFNGLSVITNDVVEASEYPRDRRHIALEKDRHLPSEVTVGGNAHVADQHVRKTSLRRFPHSKGFRQGLSCRISAKFWVFQPVPPTCRKSGVFRHALRRDNSGVSMSNQLTF